MMFQSAPCENQFRAIELSMLSSKACDITGIVAIACARHGCFAPNSVANLVRGEQQKNVDWALLQALKTTNVDERQGLMFIYDIACQYIIHLKDRIGHLLPSNLVIDAAIGLFHVHGHKDTCFFRYATSFIPGAAVVAGEILESLWSTLNTVTPAMRTATLAHRAEIMDDHMTDSNHKKLLGIGECKYLFIITNLMVVVAKSLVERYNQSVETSNTANQYYEKLIKGINSKDIREWDIQIQDTENNRMHDRSVMDILGAKQQVDMDAAASRTSSQKASRGSVAEWIQLGMEIEEKQ